VRIGGSDSAKVVFLSDKLRTFVVAEKQVVALQS